MGEKAEGEERERRREREREKREREEANEWRRRMNCLLYGQKPLARPWGSRKRGGTLSSVPEHGHWPRGGLRLALVSCPRASGNFGMVDGGWDRDALEHFPDVMPYTVRSMAWSAKRKRMRTKESQAWQEEMSKLKSKWGNAGREDEAHKQAESQESDEYMDDWHWCAHADAVKTWKEQRSSWSTDRVKAFHVAQKRLNNYNASRQRESTHVQLPPLNDVIAGSDPLGLYAALGVDSSASLKDIKKAFREAAVENHPDLNNGDASAETKMKFLIYSYEVLKSSEKRYLYDTAGVADI